MSKNVSAGVGEQMQYLAHRHNDTTLRFIIEYPGMLSSEILCTAARALSGSADVLHSSFIAGCSSAHWRINSEWRDCDFFSLTQCDGDPVKPSMGLALEPIDHRAKCQMHVSLVQGSKTSAVVFRLSHLVADGSDGKYLLTKLAEAYRLVEHNGSADGLIIKQGSRSAMQAYNDLKPRELCSLVKMPFSGEKTQFDFARPTAHGPCRMLRSSIPADIFSAAREQAKAQNATANDLILTACFRSYARLTGKHGMAGISSMMDLRQHSRDGASEGLANMSGGFTTALELGSGRSFREDLELIVRQTKAAKNDPLAGLDGLPALHAATKLLPMWLLLQAADIVYGNMCLSLTNLGNISCRELAMGGLMPTRGIFGGPLKIKPSLQISAASFDGAAELAILGDFAPEDTVPLQSFLDGIRKEIIAYARQADETWNI